MKLFDPDPNLRWLFAMTHPDDELAICGWIRRLTALGAQVTLSWSHNTPEREYEARQVAKLLHVADENLVFHQGPDRCLEQHMTELALSFRRMFQNVQPDRVVVGAFEQGHLDHDATNRVVQATYDGIILETPLYHSYCNPIPVINRFASSTGEELLELLPYEFELKRKAAQSYPSQSIWGNLVWYSLLQRIKGDREQIGAVERLRLQTHTDFRTPNLPPKLARRVERTGRWQRWCAALEAFESQKAELIRR